MKKLLLLLVLVSGVPYLWADDDGVLKAYWDSGLRIKSTDESFKIKIGGRIQADWAAFSQDTVLKESAGEMSSGAEVRRAEFYSEGKIHNNVVYKLEIEFAGDLGLEDAFIEVRDLPFGSIRFGHDEQRAP